MVKRIVRDFRFWIGFAVIGTIIVLAFIGPSLAPNDPYRMNGGLRFAAVGEGGYFLGGDEYGRDVFSRVLSGARLSMTVSIFSVSIALTAGTLLGMIAGYFRGKFETFIMRGIDVLMAFPSIIFAIFIVSLLGTHLHILIIVIGILYIPKYARIVYSVTLGVREVEYVEASRALGATHWRTLQKAVVPNLLAPLIVQASLSLGDAILLESSLSFLGLGPPPPAIAWGRMVSEAGGFLHLGLNGLIWPALLISLTVIAFNIVGDALRDAMDRKGP